MGVSTLWNSRDCTDTSRYVGRAWLSSGVADQVLLQSVPAISHTPVHPSAPNHIPCDITSLLTYLWHLGLSPITTTNELYHDFHWPAMSLTISPSTDLPLAPPVRSCSLALVKQDWHGIFLRFDRDDSGTIDRKELHAALLGFGFSLPPEMVKRLEKRFAPPPQPGLEHQKRGISFDRFLLACVTVKHYTEAFGK